MNEQVQTPPANQISVLRNDLQNMEGQFKAALPAHIPVERFTRVVMTAIQNNPDLINKVDRRSLWNSAIKAAQDGLLPDGREGAIVAYGSQAQWMPMVAGIRKKVRNSGEIATWETEVVHERDLFDYERGDEPHIKHKPFMAGDPGAVIAAYSIATLKSGEKSREVMSVAAIEKIRQRSKAKNAGPWVTDYEEMCRKTVARRHSKVLPMSTDLDDLLRRDDALYDLKEARDEAPERLKTLSGKLDALTHAGEVIDAVKIESEPPSESQGGTSLAHPGPAADGAKPAPAEGTPSPGTPNAGAGANERMPTSETEYSAYARAWIARATDASAAGKRWNLEIDLREKCGMSGEGEEVLADEVAAKVKSLRAKKG